MPPPEQPLSPQGQTIFLLGQLTGQVSALQSSLGQLQAEQAATNAATQTQMQALRSDVDFLKAKMPTRAPWYAVAGGIAGILGASSTAVALIVLFSQLNPQ